jgi:hypothetical protein
VPLLGLATTNEEGVSKPTSTAFPLTTPNPAKLGPLIVAVVLAGIATEPEYLVNAPETTEAERRVPLDDRMGRPCTVRDPAPGVPEPSSIFTALSADSWLVAVVESVILRGIVHHRLYETVVAVVVSFSHEIALLEVFDGGALAVRSGG